MVKIICAVLMILFSTKAAYAYLDPGTATIALQALIGGIAAASLFFRSRISAFFSWLKRFGASDSGERRDRIECAPTRDENKVGPTEKNDC